MTTGVDANNQTTGVSDGTTPADETAGTHGAERPEAPDDLSEKELDLFNRALDLAASGDGTPGDFSVDDEGNLVFRHEDLIDVGKPLTDDEATALYNNNMSVARDSGWNYFQSRTPVTRTALDNVYRELEIVNVASNDDPEGVGTFYNTFELLQNTAHASAKIDADNFISVYEQNRPASADVLRSIALFIAESIAKGDFSPDDLDQAEHALNAIDFVLNPPDPDSDEKLDLKDLEGLYNMMNKAKPILVDASLTGEAVANTATELKRRIQQIEQQGFK